MDRTDPAVVVGQQANPAIGLVISTGKDGHAQTEIGIKDGTNGKDAGTTDTAVAVRIVATEKDPVTVGIAAKRTGRL